MLLRDHADAVAVDFRSVMIFRGQELRDSAISGCLTAVNRAWLDQLTDVLRAPVPLELGGGPLRQQRWVRLPALPPIDWVQVGQIELLARRLLQPIGPSAECQGP